MSWCWALEPDGGGTRLLSRVRARAGVRAALWLLGPVLDLPWLVRERQMLRGIARRAESDARGER